MHCITHSTLAVSLSADGNILAIGAFLHDGQNGTNSGETKVYAFNKSTLEWDLRGIPIDGEGIFDSSGWSVKLSDNGHVLVVGAPLNDGSKSFTPLHT